MKYLGIDYSVRNLPELDPEFIPFGVWIDAYEKEAEKYYGNSSYKFEFANDVLAYVTISYTP